MADRARRKPAMQARDFAAALGPQAVIHAERADGAASRPSPAIGEDRQRETVGPAGDGHRNKGLGLEPRQRFERRAELGNAQRRHGKLRGQHPKRFFSLAACSFSVLAACGKVWSRALKVTQAFLVWFPRASDTPSFSIVSGAFGLLG